MDLQGLKRWFEDRPKWLQDATRKLVQSGSLSDQDYQELLGICKSEAVGTCTTFSGLPVGSLALQDPTGFLRLESIANVKGINALCPRKALEFGKAPLCIVYGRNGSGKSGYVRLLKHACGVRRPGDLLGNIFASSTQPQTAELTFTDDGKTTTCQWTGEPLPELGGVEIYDTTCGLVYINEENEIAYEPPILRLFTQLTSACTTLAERINTEIDGLVSSKPILPKEYAATPAADWYASISGTTTSREVDEKVYWKSEDEAELTETARRLSETNPSEKAAQLRRQANSIIALVSELKSLSRALGDSRCAEYLRAKADASKKRKAADEDAAKVFSKAPLEGVGSEAWRLLWEAARKYSEENAYRTTVFPNIAADASCVLCQRELDRESRDRFVSFEGFVKSELQRLATQAEDSFQESAASLPSILTAVAFNLRMDAAGIIDDETRSMITGFLAEIDERKQTCLKSDRISQISPLPKKTVLIRLVQSARSRACQARSYDIDAHGQNLPTLQQRHSELSARKWLHQQREAIDREIARLAAIQQLQAAQDLTSTTALSRRKSILTDELITNAYVQRFEHELRALGAQYISVELRKTRAEIGRVYHRICLKNATTDVRTSEILSEGEFRVVSLAAFLADAEGRGAKDPFIFDDPISSLDHVYEEAVAKRLVELIETRQFIVFTHRLSLVGYLIKYAENSKIDKEVVCLSRYVPGDITDSPIEMKKTDTAVNTLLNERLAAARKAFAQGDVAYEIEAKALCRDIRVLIERVVEVDLLNGVIRRFSPEVNTKGKINALAAITEDECKFVDNYMTKYSRYEHSQPEESPVPLPPPDEIERDLNAIKGFIDEICRRKKH